MNTNIRLRVRQNEAEGINPGPHKSWRDAFKRFDEKHGLPRLTAKEANKRRQELSFQKAQSKKKSNS